MSFVVESCAWPSSALTSASPTHDPAQVVLYSLSAVRLMILTHRSSDVTRVETRYERS